MLFEFHQGDSPLMLSNPHGGTEIPEELESRMTPAGRERRDTDWHLAQLYDFDELRNASRITSNISRYVVDLNRASNNEHLYPGQNTTGLCPIRTFAELPIYLEGQEPGDIEIANRVEAFWKPYHNRLSAELERLTGKFGFAVLLDAHSIADRLPMLFKGRLPDFNFGTNHGDSCEVSLQTRVESFAGKIEGYSAVVNQRFIGGFITRHYGSRANVNAVQLELVQANYMDQKSLDWNDSLARKVQPTIRAFVRELQDWIESKR